MEWKWNHYLSAFHFASVWDSSPNADKCFCYHLNIFAYASLFQFNCLAWFPFLSRPVSSSSRRGMDTRQEFSFQSSWVDLNSDIIHGLCTRRRDFFSGKSFTQNPTFQLFNKTTKCSLQGFTGIILVLQKNRMWEVGHQNVGSINVQNVIREETFFQVRSMC